MKIGIETREREISHQVWGGAVEGGANGEPGACRLGDTRGVIDPRALGVLIIGVVGSLKLGVPGTCRSTVLRTGEEGVALNGEPGPVLRRGR